MSRRLWLLLALAACDGDATDAPTLLGSTPPYGPLVGGTRITLTGSGFTSGGAAPNRVLVAGQEAPLAATIDDATLEVVIPAGAQPGDAEIVVLNGNGNTRATGIFHYSTPPAITAVEPASVVYSSGATITLRGTGFLDEDAGDVTVVAGGQLVTDVEVTSDTTLTFTAPIGRPLMQPDLELVDGRGRATRSRAFRYAPSLRRGLLLFPHSANFAVFFDPADHSTVVVPWAVAPAVRFTAVVRDPHGDYWGVDRNAGFGRIDMNAQRLEAPIQAEGWFPAMTRIGDELLGLERGSLRFGVFDPATGGFTARGADLVPCCGSYGLASSDGGTTYLTAREAGTVGIYPIDPLTGARGTPVPLVAPPGFHLEDMRFFDGTLYASTGSGTLVTIDPTTGVVTTLPVNLGRFSAMELYP